ncbi:MAG: tail fiber domain-containing protein, partial [Planctomycetota bacterium]
AIVAAAIGAKAVAKATGSGTITDAAAIDAIVNNGAAAIITRAYGLLLDTWTNAGTVGTSYGIYGDNTIGIGSTAYNLYMDADIPSYLNGSLGIGTTTPAQILDLNQGSGNMIADGYDTHSLAEYKEGIREVEDGILDKLKQAPPKRFRLRAHKRIAPREHIGLIANTAEVMRHLPEVVSRDDNENPTGISLVDYIGVLHTALIETANRIEALEAKQGGK